MPGPVREGSPQQDSCWYRDRYCVLITRLLTSTTGSLRLLPDKHIPYTSNISPNLGLLHEQCYVVIDRLRLIQ